MLLRTEKSMLLARILGDMTKIWQTFVSDKLDPSAWTPISHNFMTTHVTFSTPTLRKQNNLTYKEHVVVSDTSTSAMQLFGKADFGVGVGCSGNWAGFPSNWDLERCPRLWCVLSGNPKMLHLNSWVDSQTGQKHVTLLHHYDFTLKKTDGNGLSESKQTGSREETCTQPPRCSVFIVFYWISNLHSDLLWLNPAVIHFMRFTEE